MEIEFRGMRKDNNKWVYGYFVYDYRHSNHTIMTNTIGIYNAGFKPPRDAYDLEMVDVIPETVGMYVGKSDANKIKIYDGDILNAGDRIVVVKWNMGCGCWDSDWIEYIGERTSNGVEFAEWELRCEVIGNIHTSEKEKAKQMPYTEKDTCVRCGRYVPEGRNVCPVCEKEVE
jgi:hypothetical protein